MFIDHHKYSEKTKKVHLRVVGLALFLVVLHAMFPQESHSQEGTPQPSGQEPNSSDSPQEPVPDQPTTSTLETGQASDQNNRIVALRWGHLSAISVDTFYAYDSNFRNSAINPQGESALAARVVASYSIGNERTGLDFQYRPDILISQTNQDYQFGACLVDLHLLRPIGERWIFALRDGFLNEPDFALFNTPTVSLDSTGGFTQQAILPNGTTALRNNLSAVLTYRLAQHDHLTFHAQDEYVELNAGPNAAKSSALFLGASNTVGGGVRWGHALGPSHEFSVGYSYDQQVFGGFGSHSQYHSVLATYKQKLGRTVLLQASGGLSLVLYGDGTRNQKTFIGSVELSKKFRQSSIALIYNRGYDYTGIITNGYHDRYDGFYNRVFRNQWGFEVGAAYVQVHSTSLFKQVEERIVFGRASYYLNKQWTLFASVTNSAFGGPTQPVINRNFATVGARWSYGGQREIQP